MNIQTSTASSLAMPDGADKPVLMTVRGISKSYPGVRAVSGVDLDIRAGEVHAICGENGAGKSTLMKMLAGNIQPDEGRINFRGEDVRLTSPLRAKALGILLVHQEISLVPDLSVAENIYLGNLPKTAFGRIDWARLNRMARETLASTNLDVDPTAHVRTLSIARQQMVEIARASALQCSVVIFDEPTASLAGAEVEALYEQIDALRARGVAVVYISHRMNEIFRLSDRITVLRDGKLTGTVMTKETSEAELTQMMIGRSLDAYFHRAKRDFGPELLRIETFAVPGFVDDISLSVRSGEVLGLYGLVGAGRSELAEAVFGLRARTSGALYWDGKTVDIRSASDAIALRMALVPEDRKRQGLVLSMGVQQNSGLASLESLARLGVLSVGREQKTYRTYAERLRIKAASPSVAAGSLSGGNQQKVVLAKWLATDPRLLILDEPTRGIDVGAKQEFHTLISQLAEAGMAIVLISSEMPEILGLCHRILAIREGRITGEFDGATATEKQLIDAVMLDTGRDGHIH